MGIFDFFSNSPEKMLGDYFDKSIMAEAKEHMMLFPEILEED